MLIGPETYAIPTLANTIALGGFVSIALGGQGSFVGALLGGLLVGLASSFATRYIGANYADLAVLALLLVTLLGAGRPDSASARRPAVSEENAMSATTPAPPATPATGGATGQAQPPCAGLIADTLVWWPVLA